MDGDFSKLLVLRIMIMDVTYEIMTKVKRGKRNALYIVTDLVLFHKEIKITEFITKIWAL